MNKFALLIQVSRPFGWIWGPAVFLFGSLFASNNSGNMTITPSISLTPLAVLQILMLSFPVCVLLYGINDVYDYESDKINPRKKLFAGVKLEPEYHSFVKNVSLLVISLLLLTSFFTLNFSNILGMVLLVFFSYFYSAPPLRLKERPPLDSVSNGIGFFSVFLLGFSLGGGSITTLGIGVYLLTACFIGVHAFSTITDYEADKKAGMKTFATVFGIRSAAFFALLVFILTIIFARLAALLNPSPLNPFSSHNFFYIYCYLIFGSVLFLTTVVFPSEKIARLFYWLIALVTIIAIILGVFMVVTGSFFAPV